MAPKIGFPHDPALFAKKKEQTLNNLLSSRARAWHSYLDTMSLAYDAAHTEHETTLKKIKEEIKNKLAFIRQVLFGAIIPGMIGGGMGNLVSTAGKQFFPKLLPVAKKYSASLADFGVGATGSSVKDLVKYEVGKALNELAPDPGSEWDAVGDSPLKFFLHLNRMVDQYTTDVTRSVELARNTTRTMDDLQGYIDALNAHLLSPFIQNAPMDTDRLYNERDLAPVYEIFLWIVWARHREVNYWSNQISIATEPDDRSMVGQIWNAAWSGDESGKRVDAELAVKQLDPILERLRLCGIHDAEVTQGIQGGSRKFLNILWVRVLGSKHSGSLLSDLVSNLDAKVPKSALDDRPIDKSRRLK
jgi:hypothetical protein